MMSTLEPQIGDAFGQMLRAQHADLQRPQHELVERDDGFLGITDARTYFSKPDQLGPLEALACSKATGRVLDIGCGAGRHALAMAARGLDVTGLEPSAGAAQVARDRGVSVLEGRLDQLAEGEYDTIVMLGNNLSLLAGPGIAPALLTRLAGRAAPGAVLLGQSIDPYATDEAVHKAYHRRNRDRGRPGGQLRIRIRFRELATGWFDYWFLTVDELARLVEPTGWTLADVTREGPGFLATLRLELPK